MRQETIRTICCLIMVILSILTCYKVYSKAPKSFNEAKPIAMELWAHHRYTIYCGNSYSLPYGYLTSYSSFFKAGKKITWEHIVPASVLRQGLNCNNRKDCQRHSAEFNRREGELHNLVPCEFMSNIKRQDYLYDELPNKSWGIYCLKLDKFGRLAEPPDRAKGLIARTTLYMIHKYKLKFPKEKVELYNKWNREYPAQDWEIEWNQKIQAVEAEDN